MPELIIVVPTRGRPHIVGQVWRAFKETCTANTAIVFAVDESDRERRAYGEAVAALPRSSKGEGPRASLVIAETDSMVAAANYAAMGALRSSPDLYAIGLLHDDHRPESQSWDERILEVLDERPGIAYGNDLIARGELPSHCIMSAGVAGALGHLAPDVLRHLFLGDYWRMVAAHRLSYVPEAVIRHSHPLFCPEVVWDEVHQRAYESSAYERDARAYDLYMAQYSERDILRVDYAARSAGMSGMPVA